MDFNDLIRTKGPSAVVRSIESARAYQPECSIAYRKLSDVEATPIFWLWTNRIARGKLTVIAGDPGLGKSQLSIYLASVTSNGGTWPDGQTTSSAGNVVLVSAEDDAADTIRPRIEAAGADAERCYVLDAVREEEARSQSSLRQLNLQTDLSKLTELLNQIGGADLIVVDPLSAYLGSIDSHRNADVRSVLAPLSRFAEDHQCALVAISHLNKATSTGAISRVSGSGAFVAAARAAFVVVKDADDHDRRLFLPLKNNLAEDATGLAFRVEKVKVQDNIEAPRIRWEPDPVHITADEALSVQPDREERSAADEAMEFISEILTGGEVRAADAKSEAEALGISEKSLRTARSRLGVKSKKRGFGTDGAWYWQLSGVEDA